MNFRQYTKFNQLTSDIFHICNFFKKMLITNMLKHTRNTNNSGIHFYKQIYDQLHCTKTAKMLDTQNCLQNYIKNAKASKFLLQSAFYMSKRRTYKVLPFYIFWFKFCDKFCSPYPIVNFLDIFNHQNRKP